MALPASGQISLADIQTEFGGSNPIGLNEYYKGGSYVTATDTAPNVPASGQISVSNLQGAAKVYSGQQEYTGAGTYTWVAPSGVTSVSVLCVGAGSYGYGELAGSSSFSGAGGTLTAQGGQARTGGGGTTIGSSLNGGTVGGGNGGGGGYAGGQNAAGGGAGGYGGNGGTGGRSYNCMGNGGGVGIYGGTGAGGGAGYANTDGAPASGGSGINYGGGGGHCDGGVGDGGGGGGLRYVTSYAVTAGNSYTVTVGAGNGYGAVRIIWGPSRAYPNTNTANV